MSENQVVKYNADNNNAGEIITNPEAQVLNFGELSRRMGIRGIPITARDLVDQTFVIFRAKRFESAKKKDTHAWYCIVKLQGSDDLYSVVIGGGACVEVLDALASADIDQPLEVTLRFKVGGSHDGYYFFE